MSNIVHLVGMDGSIDRLRLEREILSSSSKSSPPKSSNPQLSRKPSAVSNHEVLMTQEDFEQHIRRGEISPLAWVSSEILTSNQYIQARDLPLFVSLYDDRKTLFRQHFRVTRPPIVTGIVIFLCASLFLWCWREDGSVGSSLSRRILLTMGAKTRPSVLEDGESWRLLVANFLHRDVLHIAVNLLTFVNIGAVLEGVYRRGDYILLLLLSGLSTMLLSCFMSNAITVGASGMIFGCLGAAVIFGWRYHDILPSRYRWYFSLVVVIYTAIVFYLGLQAESTDNWGHAGGLLAGMIFGSVVDPRLLRLRTAREPIHTVVKPYIYAFCVMVIFVKPVGMFCAWWSDRYEMHPVASVELRMATPVLWQKLSDPMGFLAYGNGVDAIASIGCARSDQEIPLDVGARRFVAGELNALEKSGHATSVAVGPTIPSHVGGGSDGTGPHYPAVMIPFTFSSKDGPFHVQAFVFTWNGISQNALASPEQPPADRPTHAGVVRECVLLLAARADAAISSQERLEQVRRRLLISATPAADR